MPSLKKIADAAATELVGSSWIGDVLPHGAAEASAPKRSGGKYGFDLTFYRERGHPKMYRVTLEEIH